MCYARNGRGWRVSTRRWEAPEWKRQENWLSEKPLGSVSEPSWYGVETDSNGRVTRLKLNSINLKGELPSELWELTELKDLLLYDNPGLTGGIPSGIGNLAKLEVLRLDQTGLSGELPPEVGELPLMNAGEYRGSDYIERGIMGGVLILVLTVRGCACLRNWRRLC